MPELPNSEESNSEANAQASDTPPVPEISASADSNEVLQAGAPANPADIGRSQADLESSESREVETPSAHPEPLSDPVSVDAGRNAPNQSVRAIGTKPEKAITVPAFDDLWIAVICVGALFLSLWLLHSRSEQSDLRIFPTSIEGFQKQGDAKDIVGTVHGIVVQNDAPCDNASVMAIAVDGLGNRVGGFASATKDDGSFDIKMASLAGNANLDHAFTDIQLIGRKTVKGWLSNDVMTGNVTIKLKRGGIIQDFKPELRNLVLVFFCASLLLALFTPSAQWAARFQHFGSIVLTCALSATVVYAFGYGMALVDDLPERDAARLGFATIFKGSYVADLPEEWLVSLTSPPERFHKSNPAVIDTTPQDAQKTARKSGEPVAAKPSSDTVSGVGAPLWFLFLGTIGAMLLTFDLVITEIGVPPSFALDTNSRKELRIRLRKYVQHSFFVLFAPIAGLFLYQLLAQTKISVSPILVGIIALGTGPILPPLLERGARQALQLIQPRPEREAPAEAPGEDAMVNAPEA